VPFDISPRFGQEGFQHGLGRLLVQPVLRRGGGRCKRLFEEGYANAFGAAHFPERGRGPRLALHHLSEQRQPHGNDLAVLSEASDGLIEEGVLLWGEFLLRQSSEGPPIGG
jgi:hypothetical protein